MITLTTPSQINSVLGGNAPVGYDKLVITPITFDPIARTIRANLRLTSTANPGMEPVGGTLAVSEGEVTVSVEQINFRRRITPLTAGQQTSVRGMIADAQNSLESGLVGLGVVQGVQSSGV